MWEKHPEAMKSTILRHHTLMIRTLEAYGGVIIQTEGNAIHSVFNLAHQALASALQAQRLLVAEDWGETGPVKVRMGLHTGP
jgi:class 3 adenylate cyclase